MRMYFVGALFALVAMPASAQVNDQAMAQCNSPNPDERIVGCEVLIRSGQFRPAMLANGYLNRGVALGMKGRYDEAIADLTEAIALNPSLSAAYYWRGEAWASKNAIDKAIADFTAAIRLNPDYAQAYTGRGIQLAKKLELDAAIADFNTSLRLRPNDVRTLVNRGGALGLNHDPDRAIADLTEALRLRPGLREALVLRGIRLTEKGEYRQAISDFDGALAASQDQQSFAYRGRCDARASGNFELDKALADCDRAIELSPNDGSNFIARALTHLRRREYADAIVDADRSIRLNPRADPYFIKGLAEQMSGDMRDGSADIARALAINPRVGQDYERLGLVSVTGGPSATADHH